MRNSSFLSAQYLTGSLNSLGRGGVPESDGKYAEHTTMGVSIFGEFPAFVVGNMAGFGELRILFRFYEHDLSQMRSFWPTVGTFTVFLSEFHSILKKILLFFF